MSHSTSRLSSLHSVASSTFPLLPFGTTLFAVVESLRPATTQQFTPAPSESDLHEASHRRLSEDYFSSRNDLELSGASRPILSASATAARMHLSTACPVCASPVQVEVPQWMMDAMGAPDKRRHSGVDEFENGKGRSEQISWRATVVEGSIDVARAIKASSIPGIIYSALKAIVTFMIYLDSRFSLHQRIAILLSALLEGLIEIEREVGIFRGAGEAISVLWEASVKSTIALAKTETNPPATSTAPPLSSQQQQSRSYFHRSTPSYPLSSPTFHGPSPTKPANFEPNPSPTLSRRTLRPSYSSPSLPLLLSTSSSSHLLASSNQPTITSTSVPLSRVSSNGSSAGCLSPPLINSRQLNGNRHGHQHHPSSHSRRRSRSAHSGERISLDEDDDPRVVLPGAIGSGWARQMVGVVGRRVFDRSV